MLVLVTMVTMMVHYLRFENDVNDLLVSRHLLQLLQLKIRLKVWWTTMVVVCLPLPFSAFLKNGVLRSAVPQKRCFRKPLFSMEDAGAKVNLGSCIMYLLALSGFWEAYSILGVEKSARQELKKT